MKGLIAPFSGFKMIFTNRKVFFASLVPIVINILLFIALAFMVYLFYDDVLSLVVKNPDTIWKKLLYWVSFVFFFIFALAVFIFSFSIIGAMLVAPFSGVIARNVEGSPARAGQNFFKDTVSSIKIELKKLFLIFIPIAVLYVIGFFVFPIAVIAFILSCWAITLEYMDYIMEEKGLSMMDRIKMLFKSPVQTFIFGLIASFMVSIPVIGLFCIPSSVAGATLLYGQINKR